MSLKLRFNVQCVTLVFSSWNCQKLLLRTLYCLVELSQSSNCIPHEHEFVLQSKEMWSLWEKAEWGVGISSNSFNIESERVQTPRHSSLGSSEVSLFSIPFYT